MNFSKIQSKLSDFSGIFLLINNNESNKRHSFLIQHTHTFYSSNININMTAKKPHHFLIMHLSIQHHL